MIRLYLLLFLCCIISSLGAQNYTAVAPWDNALSYHPAMVGVDTDESFQMNIFSQQSILEDSLTRALLPRLSDIRDFIDFNAMLLVPTDIKNSYFLGYQKTVALKRQNRITAGLQLQHVKEIRRRTENATSIGFTINYHKPLAKKKYKTRYFSLGYQLNLIFNTPNRSVTPAAFNTLNATSLSFDEFNAQFRNSSTNQNISFNYAYLREKRTSLQLGLTFSFYNLSEPRRLLSLTDGTIFFRNESLFQARLNFDFQQVLRDKLVLYLNILTKSNGQAGVGLGFRIKKHSILKLEYVQSYYDSPNIFSETPIINSNAQVALDMKRYKYIVTYGLGDFRILKFGVVYRLEDRDTSSMLSINN